MRQATARKEPDLNYEQACKFMHLHSGDAPMVGYVVERREQGDLSWEVMGLRWDSVSDAEAHAKKLELMPGVGGLDSAVYETRLARITVEVYDPKKASRAGHIERATGFVMMIGIVFSLYGILRGNRWDVLAGVNVICLSVVLGLVASAVEAMKRSAQERRENYERMRGEHRKLRNEVNQSFDRNRDKARANWN